MLNVSNDGTTNLEHSIGLLQISLRKIAIDNAIYTTCSFQIWTNALNWRIHATLMKYAKTNRGHITVSVLWAILGRAEDALSPAGVSV